MNKEELIRYWIESSDQDFKAMEHLFEKGDYHWSLFIRNVLRDSQENGYKILKN